MAGANFPSVDDAKDYLRQLLFQAVTETKGLPERPVKSFFRNKNKAYWTDVDNKGKVMMPIEKDLGGDKRSPINGELKGVFLDITLRNGELPIKSPFGPMRVVLPIEGLYDETTNLFFTDFYCKGRNRKGIRNHFVTLVLTKKNFIADDFCKKKLLQLNPETNRFLKRCYGPGQMPSYSTIANPPMHVEVFYTEPVNQQELEELFGTRVYRCSTATIGKGSSTRGGIPKDPSCTVCNPTSESLIKGPLAIELLHEDDFALSTKGASSYDTRKGDIFKFNRRTSSASREGHSPTTTKGASCNETHRRDTFESTYKGATSTTADRRRSLASKEKHPTMKEASFNETHSRDISGSTYKGRTSTTVDRSSSSVPKEKYITLTTKGASSHEPQRVEISGSISKGASCTTYDRSTGSASRERHTTTTTKGASFDVTNRRDTFESTSKKATSTPGDRRTSSTSRESYTTTITKGASCDETHSRYISGSTYKGRTSTTVDMSSSSVPKEKYITFTTKRASSHDAHRVDMFRSVYKGASCTTDDRSTLSAFRERHTTKTMKGASSNETHRRDTFES